MIIRVLLLAMLLSACAPQPSVPIDEAAIGLDGLTKVSSKYFGAAFVRPGVDFSRYQELLVSGSELAFRTPDRAMQQFPLSAEQKDRFRTFLDAQFAEELGRLDNLQLTDAVGPNALAVQVRVQDILATVPPNVVGGSGWGALSLRAMGEATLVIELSDSESGEVLARVYDRRAIEGVAIAQDPSAPMTRWEDVEAMCEKWASTVRDRLDVLVATRSP